MPDMQLGNAGTSLVKQASTPVAGVALVNGTPTILSWTPPNDGQLHRVLVYTTMTVQSAMTGGNINLQFEAPDGTFAGPGLLTGGQSAGYNYSGDAAPVIVKGGQTVMVIQGSALTAGAAILWAEIWGS